MMPQDNKLGPNSPRDAQQKLAPNLARPLLKIRYCSEPLRTLDYQLDPKPRAHTTHELFIAKRLIAANPMVQMSRRDLQPASLANFVDRISKRNRISPTRQPNQQ